MKAYIAARYSQKNEMKQVADILHEKLGMEITSSWLQEPHIATITMDELPIEEILSYAERDMQDIDNADIVILFSIDPLIASVRGGRHVETGYALAKQKPIYVVGPKENIFHELSCFKHFSTIAELIVILKERMNK
jgi:nucleoside 2-deoxyribosyltransferase